MDEEEKQRKMNEEMKKRERRDKALEDFEKDTYKIKEHFMKLKFYGYIKSYSSYEYDINEDYDYDFEINTNYNNQLKEFYKEKEKRKNWDEQIERSKYKNAIQCYGPMECEKGYEYSDDGLGYGICKGKVKYEDRLLYWVDGNEIMIFVKIVIM